MSISHIEAALIKKSGREMVALKEIVEAREGASFISGLYLGHTAGVGVIQTEIEEERRINNVLAQTLLEIEEAPKAPVIRKSKTLLALSPFSLILILSLLCATFLSARAIGWDAADAQYQDREIVSVEVLKRRGWAPTPDWSKHQTSEDRYNPIDGSVNK